MSDRGSTGAPTDVWESGEAYEPYVGRWSRLVAQEFLAWLAMPARARWLDVGCGTGALVQTILDHATPAEVVGIDPSSGYIAYARRTIADRRVRFEVGDARALPVASSYDAVVSGLVLNFVPPPDQARAAREMVRTARVGGTVASYVWDYAGEMQVMRHFWDAAVALDPAARELDEGVRFPLCHPDALTALFRVAGLNAVETRAIDVPSVFRGFDDYWSPFLGGQGPAPAYAVSLDEERRVALRERIRAGLPIEPDGSIRLIARAWAVRGVR
jgi:SAM-dependent methyltransferase